MNTAFARRVPLVSERVAGSSRHEDKGSSRGDDGFAVHHDGQLAIDDVEGLVRLVMDVWPRPRARRDVHLHERISTTGHVLAADLDHHRRATRTGDDGPFTWSKHESASWY